MTLMSEFLHNSVFVQIKWCSCRVFLCQIWLFGKTPLEFWNLMEMGLFLQDLYRGCLPKRQDLAKTMGFDTKTGFGTFYLLVRSCPQMADTRMGFLPDGAPMPRAVPWEIWWRWAYSFRSYLEGVCPKNRIWNRKWNLAHFTHWWAALHRWVTSAWGLGWANGTPIQHLLYRLPHLLNQRGSYALELLLERLCVQWLYHVLNNIRTAYLIQF